MNGINTNGRKLNRSMLAVLAALIGSLNISKAALGDDLNALISKKDCYDVANIAVMSRAAIGESYLGRSPTSQTSITSQMKAISERHLGYILGLKSVREHYSAVPSSLEDLGASIRELNSGRALGDESLGNLVFEESRLLHVIQSAKNAIHGNRSAVVIAKQLCATVDQELLPQLEGIDAGLTALDTEFDMIGAFVSVAHKKRQNVRNKVLQSIRETLENKFAAATRRSIQEIRTSITEWLIVDGLTGRVYAWKLNAIMRDGPGRGLATKYLLYHEPQAIIAADLNDGEALRKEISAIGSAITETTRMELIALLDQNMGALKQYASEQRALGLRGKFERQKAQSLLLSARSTKPACLDAAAEYDLASKKSISDQEIAAVMNLYINEVDVCSQ